MGEGPEPLLLEVWGWLAREGRWQRVQAAGMETDISISQPQPPVLFPTLLHRAVCPFLLGHSEHETEMKWKPKQRGKERMNRNQKPQPLHTAFPLPSPDQPQGHVPLAFTICPFFPIVRPGEKPVIFLTVKKCHYNHCSYICE